jgi:uncharacterized SAM-binding protein YcdF (DUF218 family)
MGDVHETTAMRDFAIAAGVPADAIRLDRHGLNTAATVRHTAVLFDELNVTSAIAISHFYHLPRIKLAYQRAGRGVLTVPADERYTLTALPYYMAREIAAWWWYYWRDLA